MLTGDLTSVRADILTRYASFLQCLTRSSSREIRILASTAVSDGRCTTGSNASKLARETGLDLMTSSKVKVKETLSKKTLPAKEEWRLPLLARLLQERHEHLEADGDNTDFQNLIDLVCSSTID